MKQIKIAISLQKYEKNYKILIVRPKIELKYKIKERLELLSHEEYKVAIKTLPVALKVSSRTFFRYMYTRVQEDYNMPVDHLARLAKFFSCKIEDLLNYEPTPLSFRGIKVKDSKDLLQKFKLVR
ncbi:MAG: helix-turn-helix domain-containing protein [Bacteroidia bacterium]|nr:helix-turn-helix domain-containing protein [Bacteroidia bacterium]